MSKADIKTEKIKEKSIPIAGPDINSITYDPLNKLYYCGSMEEIKIVKESDYCISSEYKFPKLGDGRKEEKLENVENLGDIEGNIKETKEIMGREEGELVKKHYYQPHSLRFLHPPHKSPKVILSPSGTSTTFYLYICCRINGLFFTIYKSPWKIYTRQN